MIPKQVGFLGASAAIIFGGFVTLNVASTITLGALRAASEAKRKKVALPCVVCKGKGFYICKLCRGNATIEWSPLYDPVFIHPCICPTCEGNRFLLSLFLVSHPNALQGAALSKLFGEGLRLTFKNRNSC